METQWTEECFRDSFWGVQIITLLDPSSGSKEWIDEKSRRSVCVVVSLVRPTQVLLNDSVTHVFATHFTLPETLI